MIFVSSKRGLSARGFNSLAAGIAAAASIFTPAAAHAAETTAAAAENANAKSEEKSLFEALLATYNASKREKIEAERAKIPTPKITTEPATQEKAQLTRVVMDQCPEDADYFLSVQEQVLKYVPTSIVIVDYIYEGTNPLLGAVDPQLSKDQEAMFDNAIEAVRTQTKTPIVKITVTAAREVPGQKRPELPYYTSYLNAFETNTVNPDNTPFVFEEGMHSCMLPYGQFFTMKEVKEGSFTPVCLFDYSVIRNNDKTAEQQQNKISTALGMIVKYDTKARAKMAEKEKNLPVIASSNAEPSAP